MDLSRLGQFPIEIKLCHDGKSLTSKIEEYDHRVHLIKMNGREAVKYAIDFIEFTALSDLMVKRDFVERIQAPYEVDACKKGSAPVRVTDLPIADYLACRMSDTTGSIVWYCELKIS